LFATALESSNDSLIRFISILVFGHVPPVNPSLSRARDPLKTFLEGLGESAASIDAAIMYWPLRARWLLALLIHKSNNKSDEEVIDYVNEVLEEIHATVGVLDRWITAEGGDENEVEAELEDVEEEAKFADNDSLSDHPEGIQRIMPRDVVIAWQQEGLHPEPSHYVWNTPDPNHDCPIIDSQEWAFMQQFSEVLYVSGGNEAYTFHRNRDCRGLKKSYEYVNIVDRCHALRPRYGLQGRAPCIYCFPKFAATGSKTLERYLEESSRKEYSPETHPPVDSSSKLIGSVFERGDLGTIIDGPFATLTARILEVNDDSKQATAIVEIFGRETAIQIGFHQFIRI
jgi:transcription antitermination factor NusG